MSYPQEDKIAFIARRLLLALLIFIAFGLIYSYRYSIKQETEKQTKTIYPLHNTDICDYRKNIDGIKIGRLIVYYRTRENGLGTIVDTVIYRFGDTNEINTP